MVAYLGSGTLTGATGTTDVSPSMPTHQTDDVMICVTSKRTTSTTCLTPSNWTLLTGPLDTTNWRTYVFWRRADSNATPEPLCDWVSFSADTYAIVHGVRGAILTGNPIGDVMGTGGSSDPAVATGVTTTGTDQLVIVTGMNGDNLATGATVTSTNEPFNFTQHVFLTSTTGADAGAYVYSAPRPPEGATGDVSLDFNNNPFAWGVAVIAIIDQPGETADLFVPRWG